MRADRPLLGQTLNVGTGRRISLIELVEAINRVLGTRLEPRFEPARAGDVRDSLAVRVVDDLIASGAHVRAYDPALAGSHALLRCEIVGSPFDALENADALVVLTDWKQFAQIDPREIAQRLPDNGVVVDGRNGDYGGQIDFA